MKPKLKVVPTADRPLLKLSVAEKLLKHRDLSADPFMLGEGPKFWTPSRISKLRASNIRLRRDRRKT